MTETQRRIKAYKEALPALRERVIAVALLLAMSASMLTSASFAWISLSTAPEVSGMSTTVAANGNLEIALAQGSVEEGIVEPAVSQVGDSSAREGQTIAGANITWGNLVNLSEPIYGLDHIELRPALLAMRQLEKYPLNGATYGQDGRVISTDDKYGYSTFVPAEGETKAYFAAAENQIKYGVRAISSMKYDNTVTGTEILREYENQMTSAYQKAITIYSGIIATDSTATKLTGGATCIEALQSLVTVFAQEKVNATSFKPDNASDVASCSPYLYNFYEMLLLMRDSMDQEAEGLRIMANWMAYSNSEDADPDTNRFPTVDSLRKASDKELADAKVTLVTLAQHKTDYQILQNAINGIKPMAEECIDPTDPNMPVYKWANISAYVNPLCEVNSATLNGTPLTDLDVSDYGNLLGILTNKNNEVKLMAGVLPRYEQRVIDKQERLEDKKTRVTISLKTSIMNADVKGYVMTNASGDATKNTDMDKAAEGGAAGMGIPTAMDTYGMAIDLWFRTNYPDAVLTLEGGLVTESQQATGVDSEGNTVDLYIVTIGDVQADAYQKDGKWYYANGHEEITEEVTKSEKKTIEVVVGYQGENRIWEDWENLMDQGYIEKEPTTQGSGSCFVFYTETPTEQAKILELLDAFTIAFIDQNGTPIASATLDTVNAYANQGKVTVPLIILSGEDYEDEEGEQHTGIMRLTPNTPTFLTAVVYLNGQDLKNENVLSAGEIQGQLNIQFGTNTVLTAPMDEDLMSQHRIITAEATVGSAVSKDQASPIELNYSETGHEVTVKLTVDGETPKRVEGFFVRVINSTQGSRCDQFAFASGEDGTWTGTYRLTSPGDYVLSTLIVDGLQYNLVKGNHPGVSIDGLKINNVTTNPGAGTHMTVDSSLPVSVSANITAHADLKPAAVSAQFFSEDNSEQITVPLSYNTMSDNWEGSTVFTKSGTYILKYLALDGQVMAVPAQFQSQMTFIMGMTTRVYTTTSASEREYGFEGSKQHKMLVYVYDDSGREMTGLSDVVLYYRSTAQSVLEQGLPIDVAWNGSAYEGDYNIASPGTYVFEKLTVKINGVTSAIRTAETAPQFTAISLEQPQYDSSSPKAKVQLAMQNPATMDVSLKGAQTATVYAQFRNTYNDTLSGYLTTEHKVWDESKGVTVFTFDLPKADGTWVLEQVYCQNVYDKDYTDASGNVVGKFYTVDASNPTNGYQVFNGTGAETEVLATAKITVTYGGKPVPADAIALTGGFLEHKTTETVAVSVLDYTGTSFTDRGFGTPKVTWTMNYDGNSNKYSSYTTNVPSNYLAVITKECNADGVFSATQSFEVAGEYSSVISVLMPDNFAKSVTGPKFTLTSGSPTVKVTGTTTGEYRIYTKSLPSSTSDMVQGSFFNHTDYSAAVYIYTPTHNDYRDNESAEVNRPTVKLSLSDVYGDIGSATMEFKTTNTESVDTVFTFNNGSATGYIGACEQGVLNWAETSCDEYPKIYPAGKMQQNKITVKNTAGREFVVTLDNAITINNPQYPPYMDFSTTGNVFDSAGNSAGTVTISAPSRRYATVDENGDLYVTLPTVTTWTEDLFSTSGGIVNNQDEDVSNMTLVNTSTSTVYKKATTYGYYTYTRTIYEYDANSESFATTWTNQYVNTGWSIGTGNYFVGDRYYITEPLNATAVIKVNRLNETSIRSIQTKVITKYTDEKWQRKEPSYEKISDNSTTIVCGVREVS